MSSNNEHSSCLIIGSGPAGYTAAIYAARANMKPLLYQGIQPGGQLTITTDVENYPGFPDGIQGPEMMVNFEKQAARMGTDIRYGLATKVDFSGDVKKVWIDDEKIIEADAVIISTGASAKWLGIPSEEKFNGFGVSACAVCDGFFFKGKEVAIVGAGDTAAEEANYAAEKLGFAFQLANFIRDVSEDLDRGRVYLPIEELSSHNVTREMLEQRHLTKEIKNALQEQIARVRKLQK